MTAARSAPDFKFESDLAARGYGCIAGVDEVGRGPLAGPVMAAAVVLDPGNIPEGLNDSKQVTSKRRAALAETLWQVAEVGLGIADVAEIDRLNIRRATHLAMLRALAALPRPADMALIDGRDRPDDLPCAAHAIIKGDTKSLSIAAASIVAKVARDAEMTALSARFPGYGWETNAGYPTKMHRAALLDIGVSPHHRRSFRPVHNILYQEK
jgi:ribonuclease HII